MDAEHARLTAAATFVCRSSAGYILSICEFDSPPTPSYNAIHQELKAPPDLMTVVSAESVVKKLRAVRAALRHAFAVQPAQCEFSEEDRALLERVADAIVKRKMAEPAIVFLESMGPMNFLGSQALHFVSPIIECACSAQEVTQVARLLERRDSISRLIALIDAKDAPQGTPVR